MSQVERTTEARQKELRIEELMVLLKKKRTTIKRLRTRLENLKADIRNMQQKTGSLAMSVMEKMMIIQTELSEQLTQLLQHKKIKLTPEQRSVAEDMLSHIRGEENPEEQSMLEEAWAEMNGETEGYDYEGEAQSADAFAEFRPEPSAEEKRDIRKVYLKLSQAFHPDKARNDEDRAVYHKRMQQISAAYQQHDIDVLLRMEEQLLGDQFVDADPSSGTNLLDDKITRLERELSFLENQSGRLSSEIKEIRQSDSGQALTNYDRNNREGYGLDHQTAMMNETFEGLQSTLNIIKKAVEKGRMTPELAEELTPYLTPEEMLRDLMDDFDFFNPFDSSLPFQAGDYVVYSPAPNSQPIFNIKPNTKAYVITGEEEEDGSIVYDLLLEKKAYKAFRATDWEKMIEARPWVPICSIPVEDLRSSRSTFHPEDSMASARRLMTDYLLANRPFSSDAKALLPKILMTDPAESDSMNWQLFFEENPIARGIEVIVGPNPWSHMPEGSRAKLVDVIGFDPEEGLLVGVKIGRRRPVSFALSYLKLTGEGPQNEIKLLSIYQEWAAIMFPDPPQEIGFA